MGASDCLFKTTLSGQPSCIAFAPNQQDLFVIGTYQLDESTEVGSEVDREIDQNQSRSGTVQLFRLEQDGQVTHLQTHELASSPDQDTQNDRSSGAILDLRFCSLSKHRNYFASCTSTGLILLFKLDIPENPSDRPPQFQLVRTYTIFEDETLLTSLSWDPDPSLEDEADIALTLSDGRAVVVKIPLTRDTKSEAEILTTFSHHTESAWTSQWCPATESGERRLATGGDDRAIHVVTLPNNNPSTKQESNSEHEDEDEDEEELDQALHALDIHAQQNRLPTTKHLFDTRTHEAGVTSILPLVVQRINGALVILTGSYDNSIRVLESRNDSREWHTLAEWPFSGGVWKLDLLAARDDLTVNSQNFTSLEDISPEDPSGWDQWLVLASCMDSKLHVVNIARWWNSQDEWEIGYQGGFYEHESMCYASAAVPLGQRRDGEERKEEEKSVWRIVSTSFYDRLLCVWDYKCKW